MGLFAIGDLHLSLGSNKPMDVFGAQWTDHPIKIQKRWLDQIRAEDMVLIPGDISWGMTLDEAMPDLQFIDDLPGKKILIQGNHDYWWGATTKLNTLFDSMMFLKNTSEIYGDYSICGTRGWICPNEIKFTLHDEKIYKRELHRLKLSLDKAIGSGFQKIIVMTHFPPTNDQLHASDFTALYEQYGVSQVIYGHLHGVDSFGAGLQGIHNGVEYTLVSCDYIDFQPLRLKNP